MSTDGHKHLLDELQARLERLIGLARTGNISEVTTLSRQTDSLVQKIAQAGLLEMPEFEGRRVQLQELYGSLCLAITAQKAEASRKLSRVRKGRKTIAVYRAHAE